MFQRIVDDIKDSVSDRLQQASLATVAAVAVLIAIGFLCAAGFVLVLEHYGPIIACLAGAGLFLIVAIVAGIWYAARKQQSEARARQRAKAAARNVLTDPAVVATGLQLVRSIGLKRLVPLLAVGGLALGFLASRNSAQADDQATPAE